MELHAPEGGIHSWRDFFVHMATIVLGIMIAIGLEQSVEAIHHRYERRQLESDIHADLEANVKRVEYDRRIYEGQRAALVELRAAVEARRAGQDATTPDVSARRSATGVMPSFAAWEAARQSGTLALLPNAEVRIDSRFLFQLDRLSDAMAEFEKSALDLESFEERFRDSPGAFDMQMKDPAPDIRSMSPEELEEYSQLLSRMIKSLDRFTIRMRFVDMEDRVLLSGVRNDEEMLREMSRQMGASYR
ncbi:MAG TPA: hypothetical protein VHY48_06250 [Acidobacteriaceae bacterium]|jgi:hypothetical protein|nr:hypothetical protein [Acidobacteriaceae bacterium]